MKIEICRCCHRHQACACCPVHAHEAGTYATENARLRSQLASALELLEERTRERDALRDLRTPTPDVRASVTRPGHC